MPVDTCGGWVVLERFLGLLAGRRLSRPVRFAVAIAVVFAAAVLRAILPMSEAPFLFFMPALMGIAFALGRGPALLAAAVSSIVAAYLFVEVAYDLNLSARGWAAVALFAIIGSGIVAVCDALALSLLRSKADLAALNASQVALAESEAFLRSVLGASADCIKVLDLDAKIVFMSEGGQRLMEVSDFGAIRGCPWPDFWQGEGNEVAKAAVASARAGGSGHFRGAADTLAGSPRYWDVQVTPIFGPDGKPEKLLSVSRDITAARQAEDALRENDTELRIQREFLTTLIRQAPVGISITEATTGQPMVLNERAQEMLGHGSITDDLSRYEHFGAVHGDGRPYTADDYPTIRALKTGKAIEREEMLYHRGGKDSDLCHWEVSSTPVRDAQDKVTAVMTVFFDLEEQRRVADLLRDMNAMLEQRVATEVAERIKVEEALRQSQKMEAVGQLTGGIAHDFNNLLTGITGSLELLNTRMAQGRLKDLERYVTAAQGAAKRAASLTHRLLAFSRRQTLDPKPTDVNRLVSGMEDLVRRMVGPSVALEVVGAAGLWPVLVDPPQLENALLNLCINARDAMPEGGRITVETANKWLDDRAAAARDLSPGQYVSLCVTDTGVGIPREMISRVFDPFFTTKPLGQGTGLGLSMIYGFVRQSGGQVRVYSEIGQGTTMCLYLPRHSGTEPAVPSEESPTETPRAGQGETVLVVDDEVTVRMLVTEVLSDLGYSALEAVDGATGLKIVRSDVPIDLLVTDVGLPGGLNGRQLADAAREVRPALKVLFITGYAENAVVGNGHLEAGMHLLTKPFAIDTLANRIKDMIG